MSDIVEPQAAPVVSKRPMVGDVPLHPHFVPADPPKTAVCTICASEGPLGHHADPDHKYDILYCPKCGQVLRPKGYVAK